MFVEFFSAPLPVHSVINISIMQTLELHEKNLYTVKKALYLLLFHVNVINERSHVSHLLIIVRDTSFTEVLHSKPL